jgi:hypothetical protein
MTRPLNSYWLVRVVCCLSVATVLFLMFGAREVPTPPMDSVSKLRIVPEEDPSPHGSATLSPRDISAASRNGLGALEPRPGSDTPILIVTDPSNPFGGYYAEILRTEGLNLFAVVNVEFLTPERLALTDVVILTVSRLNDEKVHQLEKWVRSGGNLIAIKPEGNLLPILGIELEGDPVVDGYVRFDEGSGPGRGIVRERLQLRTPATRFALKGSTAIAHFHETANQPLGGAAITLRHVERGRAAAYAYDLARSVIRTRQGNPEWINQERDGLSPRRANDLFYPDDIDMNKIGIPQADEQQRFFANLILTMNHARRPLPRFWYLPAGRRAAIILASDDHGTKRGTQQAFAKLQAESSPGCRIEVWECYRATSYVSPDTPIGLSETQRYTALGFELGIHTDTGCKDQDIATVSLRLLEQVGALAKQKLGIQKQETHRFHCIPWNGWVDTAKVERDHGIRFSMNYYYWPESWVQGRQGFMTGSGFPMRYVDLDGQVLDIYQATTHIVDENGIDYAHGISSMIDKALGPEQFFGIFGTHYDFRDDDFLSTAIRIARERGVALVSAAQALRWFDARNNSRFKELAWEGGRLSFDILADEGAGTITTMIPLWSFERKLASIECDGESKAYDTIRVKGLDYASLPLRSGRCTVNYMGSVSAN